MRLIYNEFDRDFLRQNVDELISKIVPLKFKYRGTTAPLFLGFKTIKLKINEIQSSLLKHVSFRIRQINTFVYIVEYKMLNLYLKLGAVQKRKIWKPTIFFYLCNFPG